MEGFACAKKSGASCRVTNNSNVITTCFIAIIYPESSPSSKMIDEIRWDEKVDPRSRMALS